LEVALKTRIGLRSQLNNGEGLRFEFKNAPSDGAMNSGFVIEFNNEIFAYQNRCPHLGVELDWVPGVFFDEEQTHLVCATHGARFEPDTGKCASGPCVGRSLTAVAIVVANGELYV
jgi:nitrite reductase/ring-hydroxylating ferredoxin subunit